MTQEQARKRRSYRWSKEAREVVAQFLKDNDRSRPALITTVRRLAEITGFPKHACSRFIRQCQSTYPERRSWTRAEQQKLLDLVSANPVYEVAIQLRRSLGSVRSMLHKLGASASMGRDWFTKYTLASALHIAPSQVQRWIDSGLLKTKQLETGKLTRQVIEAETFAAFCAKHRDLVVGRRINAARLDFVQKYVFPPDHSDLLPVRESKKERAAFDLQKQTPFGIRDVPDEREEDRARIRA